MQGTEPIVDQDYVNSKSQEFVDTCSWFLMRKVVRSLTNFINDSFKETGILSTQLGTLAILAIHDKLSVSEIAKELIMDQTTATRNIKNLQKMNLLQLEEGEDKRVKMVTLTEEGKSKLMQVLPIWDFNQKMINQEVGKDNIASLEVILREILSLLQNGPK